MSTETVAASLTVGMIAVGAYLMPGPASAFLFGALITASIAGLAALAGDKVD